MHSAQKSINHFALVLDRSISMNDHAKRVIEVGNAQIQHLALRSEELNMETRVSIYAFGDNVECLIFDMDVMRTPDISDLYRISGNTALVDATMISQRDLATTSQIYGDHAFQTIVITDGDENRSRQFQRSALGQYAQNGVKDGWSLGFLVPSAFGSGRQYMKRLGVPDDMVAEWDASDADGFTGAGATVTAATESFLTSRASGQSVLRSAFSTGTDVLNAQTVKAAALTPMPFGIFTTVANRTPNTMEMKDFVEFQGMKYVHRTHFYELMNATRTIIQPQKQIIVQNRKTDQAFTDDEPGSPRVRDLINLSKTDRDKVPGTANKEFRVFVQSTATNRHVKPGMSVLTLNPASA